MLHEYPNFAALLACHEEGKDFDRVMVRRAHAGVVLLAPHGGRIEPHTAEIATQVAGENFSLYCFRSKRRKAEANLHITSHHFDDPECLALVSEHKSAVGIHGCQGANAEVFLGGLDLALKTELASSLRSAGIAVRTEDHSYPGTHPMNICNRSLSGVGVQFELTLPFRTGPLRDAFVASIREVLLAWDGAA